MLRGIDKQALSRDLWHARKLTLFDTEPKANALQRTCDEYATLERIWLKQQRNLSIVEPEILLGFYERFEPQAFAIEKIGNSHASIVMSPTCVSWLDNFFAAANARSEMLKSYIPETARDDAATIMRNYALRFLVAHERSHILHGHVRLKLGVGNLVSISEGNRILDFAEALESQTLEMDADSAATLDSLPVLATHFFLGSDVEFLQLLPNSPELNFRIWWFSIYVLFRMFDTLTSRGAVENASHPPPMYRVYMIFLVALKSFNGQPRLLDACTSGFLSSIEAGEKMVAQLLNQPVQASGMIEAHSKIGDYVKRLALEWQRLRPLLEPLNRSHRKLAT